jgi:hypothetical protein
MELDFAILARRVETRKGMSHCEFLGWKSYTMAAFPQCLDAALLFRIDYESWEVALPHDIEIYFLDEQRTKIATGKGIQVSLPVGQDHYTHTVGLQDVMIQREGSYSIEIWIDRKLVKTIPFRTRLAPERASSPSPESVPETQSAPVPASGSAAS